MITTAKRHSLHYVFLVFLLFLFIAHVPVLYAQENVVVSPYALYKQGRLREAIDSALVLIERNRNNISAYAVAGISYLGLKQWAKALEISTSGHALAPNDLRLLATMGEAHFELNQNEQALEYLSRYLLLGKPGELRHWIYYYVGSIYDRQEKFHKADIAYSAALHYDETRIAWLLQLASVKEKLGEEDAAQKIYRKVLNLEQSNNVARQKIQQFLLSNQ